MKLVGELKDKVEKAETKVEAKEIIKDAGMDLTDEELDQVAGGEKIVPELRPNFPHQGEDEARRGLFY